MRCWGTFLLVSIILQSGAIGATESKPNKPNSSSTKGVMIFTGIPVFLDDFNNSIILLSDKNEEMEFFLADTAKILQDGQIIKIKQLSTKSAVTVTYKKKKTRFYALRVDQKVTKAE